MFDPTPQRAAPAAWAPNPVLQPARSDDAGFANTDWDRVPRLDYRTESFRQLAVPDPARVVDDARGFEPWRPKSLNDATVGEPSSEENNPSGSETPTPSMTDASVSPADAMAGSPSAQASSSDEHEASDLAQPEPGGEADAQLSPESAVTEEASVDASGLTETGTPDPQAQAEPSDIAPPMPDLPVPALDTLAQQEACDTARREGYEQGRQEGLLLGREEAEAQAAAALQAALEQAEADKAQALQQLREELQDQIEPIKRQLGLAVDQVQALLGSPDQLFEPVRRLSLHLAEQLVLGELNISPAAIERLIQRCLDELDLHGKPVLTVELNPQDKARLQERGGELSSSLSVQAVPSMPLGSVRVVVNDTMVEDLVGNRLDALARGLLVQPEAWRDKSPFFKQPLAQRDTEIQDAPARVVAARETPRSPGASPVDAGGEGETTTPSTHDPLRADVAGEIDD